jgi:WXXGXW repeat (2 copies)
MMKRTAISLLAVAAILVPVASTPAAAQVFSLQIGTPPPAPVYEVVPAPRAGYAWAPGYWRWEHERHVWMPGRWMAARAHHHWVADHWVEGPHGGWHYQQGHWDRD